LKFLCVVMLVSSLGVPMINPALAAAGVGGSGTPGDPSLLTPFARPQPPQLAEPAPPQCPDERKTGCRVVKPDIEER